MTDIILDLLKEMSGKIDRISNDIATMRITNVEQGHRLDRLEEKVGYIVTKNNDINERLKKIESEAIVKADIDILFGRVRKLEETPKEKLTGKIQFVKKAVLSGIALLITGAVVFLGRFIWFVVTNMTTITEAIEQLK